MKKPTVSELILDLVKTINEDPRFINTGLCQHFATTVGEVLKKFYPASQISGAWGPGHYYLIFNNRYYDSQAPEGVTHWGQLPIFVAKEYGWHGKCINVVHYFHRLDLWKQKWTQKLCYGV